jgi:thymidine kinase
MENQHYWNTTRNMLALPFLTAGLTEHNKRHFKIYSALLPICTVALEIKAICSYGGCFGI